MDRRRVLAIQSHVVSGYVGTYDATKGMSVAFMGLYL